MTKTPNIYRILKPLTQQTNTDGTITVQWPLTTQELETPNLDPNWIVIIDQQNLTLHHNEHHHQIQSLVTPTGKQGSTEALAKTHHNNLTEAIQQIPPQIRQHHTNSSQNSIDNHIQQGFHCIYTKPSTAPKNPNPPPNPNKNTK